MVEWSGTGLRGASVQFWGTKGAACALEPDLKGFAKKGDRLDQAGAGGVTRVLGHLLLPLGEGGSSAEASSAVSLS